MDYSVKIHSIYFHISYFSIKKMMLKHRFTNVAIENTFAQLIIKQARKSIYFFKNKQKEYVFKMNNFTPKKGKISYRQFCTAGSYYKLKKKKQF